ncbi:MAG: L,D-transpeptidase family protein [Acidobacteriota bacterium]
MMRGFKISASGRRASVALASAIAVGLMGSALAAGNSRVRAAKAPAATSSPAASTTAPSSNTTPQRQTASAEARLLEIYKLIGAGQTRVALSQAESLVNEVPNFQLAQLVYADLLVARTRRLPSMGAAPGNLSAMAPQRLDQLRTEAERRLAALRERPPAGALPAQFIELPPSTKHAIAVDAARSRLYLFENGPKGLQLVADHYASMGRLGMEKSSEGDQRTPLGVYYITSRLEGRQLTDFYGSGALLLNYPNEYDRKQGRTGGGIWLHGVPSDSYSRSPNSTDGCVALANPELRTILERVQPRSTPVVIARSLQWVQPDSAEQDRRSVHNLIEGWRMARASGDVNRLMSFYSSQFSNGAYDFTQWRVAVTKEVSQQRARSFQLKDLAILGWKDKSDLLVVTFGEVADGQRVGAVKRQYWGKEGGLWKIFYEGVIG